MAELRIRSLGKTVGQTRILNDIDLDIADGELVVLVGPSGCGKSTLLRLVAGLDEWSEGEIFIDGVSVKDVAAMDRDIAMVFQNYALYPHMSVRENMSFALRLRKMPERDISRRVEEVAKILGLDALLARYPRQLSGGQRQRVAMGRAIIRSPSVFLFDEPLSNLDAQLRVAMRTEMKELHQRLRTTTVYVTHDQMEAMTLADRIVVMRGGIIEQSGLPLDIYDNPANKFVAGFIGSPGMNFIDGAIEEGEMPQFVSDTGLRLSLPAGLAASSSGRRVIYGIRPEHLRIDLENGVPARVLVVEPTGAETHVAVDMHGNEMLCQFHERLRLLPGETIPLAPDLSAASIFDAVSEKRISAR